MSVAKKLTKHGNSYALVIDKPILDLLRIDPETPLSLTVTGGTLVVAPVQDVERARKFEKAKADTFRKYDSSLRRLAQ